MRRSLTATVLLSFLRPPGWRCLCRARFGPGSWWCSAATQDVEGALLLSRLTLLELLQLLQVRQRRSAAPHALLLALPGRAAEALHHLRDVLELLEQQVDLCGG